MMMQQQSNMISSGTAQKGWRRGTAYDVVGKVICAYTICLVASMLVFHHMAEQEFSSVLTMSVFAQCLSFSLIGLQIHTSQSVRGISGRTIMLQALMLCFRLSSTLFLDGYLPLDRSGDHVYQLADLCSLLMALKVLHCVFKTYRHTYDREHDSMDVKNAVIGCVLLAVAVHPPLNDWATFDIAWAASLYIDTVAMLPQLWMCSKIGSVPAYTAHYLVATLVSRFFSAWFWYYGAENIARLEEGFSFAAAAVILAHVLQFLVLVDFGYYYLKACFSGAVCKQQPVETSSLMEI